MVERRLIMLPIDTAVNEIENTTFHMILRGSKSQEMEFIAFNSAYSLQDILILLKRLSASDTSFEIRSSAVPDQPVSGISNGRNAAPGTLCFVDRPPPSEALSLLRASIVLTDRQIAPLLAGCTLIIADDPRALFIDCVSHIFSKGGFANFTSPTEASPGIHPDADIHRSAVIEAGVYIGNGARIAAGCIIKQGSYVGDHVIIRENTVIGSEGIALHKTKDGRVLRFPHVAGIVIEDDVEIGACCVLARGTLNSSRVGRETVIGNLSNLGHAVQIGIRVWMSVGCMIGGNASIGDDSTLGLGVCVRDNSRIGKNCSIGMGSVVAHDLPDNYSVFGNPARRLPDVKAGPDR
ncbi:MAG: hypothetical protein L0Y38_01880 [Methylococcaceae bacterium]|nr:hypothetical protein [Methylococcaceae bacterium]